MEQLTSLYDLLIVQNFSGFATLLAGAVAWTVYTQQKKDKKINSARIILSEIRLAEKRIDEIKDLLERNQKNFPSVLPVNSWEKHSALFASDFDQDQIEELNEFYNNCSIIENAVKKDDRYLWLTADAISQTAQTKYFDLIVASLNADFTINYDLLEKYRSSVLNTFVQNPYPYAPQVTLNIIRSRMDKLSKLTTSTTGTKLKKLAHTKGWVVI
jgi:hypothetical protein